MEALDPILLNERQLQTRAANLHADRATKDIIRLMKGDILKEWANEKDPAKRDALWHSLQAVQAFADKLATLASDDQIARRKDAVLKRKAAARPRS